jgi:cation transport ATPase
MSIMVGVGRGASLGVLIKNAEALERFEKIDTLVIDKTGTLTEGRPKLAGLKVAEGFDEDDVLRPAATLERNREHPLTKKAKAPKVVDLMEALHASVGQSVPKAGTRKPTGCVAAGRMTTSCGTRRSRDCVRKPTRRRSIGLAPIDSRSAAADFSMPWKSSP